MEPQVGGPGGTGVFRLPSKTLDCTVRSAAITFFFSPRESKITVQTRERPPYLSPKIKNGNKNLTAKTTQRKPILPLFARYSAFHVLGHWSLTATL